MALRDRLLELRGDTIASLDEAHDFFTHTKALWRLAQIEAKRGRRLTLRNRVTQTSVTEQDLPRLAQRYVNEYMAAATLQRLMSLFEEFVLSFLREYYIEHPASLNRKEVTLEFLRSHQSVDDVVRAIIERHLRDLAYGQLRDWFDAVERIANLGTPPRDEIEQVQELKATRDVIVHNKGMANHVYVERAGRLSRYSPGDHVQVPEAYLTRGYQLLRQIIGDMIDCAASKLSRS